VLPNRNSFGLESNEEESVATVKKCKCIDTKWIIGKKSLHATFLLESSQIMEVQKGFELF
jgi:hypothetical protein